MSTLQDGLDYAAGVLSGDINVSNYTRLTFERWAEDVETAESRGYYFDDAAADHAIEFFGFVRHSKGEFAGHVFELEPWQAFIVGQYFGWMRKSDNTRRFREAYIEVPRKNGKSTLLAGIGLYLFCADDEPGAEVYTAAVKKDQARITHREATQMVKSSPELSRTIGVHRDNLHIDITASRFEPLSSDSNSLDGLNIHGAIIDELHAHRDDSLYNVLVSATGSRRQSAIISITTAGFNRRAICWQQRDYLLKILNGQTVDDTFFGVIYTIDDDDDWRSPEAWQKANPNFGVSVKADDMARLAHKAEVSPASLNNFLCKRLDVWTTQETKFLNVHRFNECAGTLPDAAELARLPCWAGLDLATVSDLAAFALLWRDGQRYYTMIRHYLPEDALNNDQRAAARYLKQWADQGLIETTPGEIIDYEFIKADVMALCERFSVREIAFDRWNATQAATDLRNEGLELVAFGQGFGSMSAPTKQLEKIVLSGELMHDGNPVIAWQAENLAVQADAAGNLKPAKHKSEEKIDGLVALIMALGRAMVTEAPTSVYETRGITTL